ncbi:MAG: sulfurtransferase TusA family protein [Geminicoccaceae bacterium]
MVAADLELDITGDVCPMTFVRTKRALEKMAIGQVLSIRMSDGEPRQNVPRAVRDHGQEIVAMEPSGPGEFTLLIRKKR